MDIKLLKDLCAKKGVSGDEREISSYVAELMKDYADEIKVTDMLNVYATKKSKNKNAKTLVLDAHIDTVGLIVKEKLENGFLAFDTVGGVDLRVLSAAEVEIGDKLGIISSKPPHLMSKEEKEKGVKLDNLFIDTGDSSENIKVGDTITFMSEIEQMGNFVSGAYLDDRAGVGIIIELFKELKDKELDFNITAVFSVGEEMGFRGAKLLKTPADALIAIDVTFGRISKTDSDDTFECLKGSTIGIGPNIHPLLFEDLKNICIKNNLDYQIEVLEGSSGTNAWAYQVLENSIACGLLSLPIKYMHTPVETMAIKDYDNLKEILKNFILSIDNGYFSKFEEVRYK